MQEEKRGAERAVERKSIFRKSSLDRVTSPEELNDYIHVAHPGVWVVLGAVTALLAGVIIWGIFGEIDGVHPIWFVLH